MSLADSLREHLKRPKVLWKQRPEVLLHPNIPKPLHGMAPRVILGQAWWDKTREAAYRSTDFHCVACGVQKYEAMWHQWLEAHELYDIDYLLGRMTYLEAVPLCHCCHNFIHSGRMQAMLDKGEMPRKKFDLIVNHGQKVLFRAGLKKPKEHSGPVADWGDWRLVLDGKEHEGKFKTFEDWKKHFEKVEHAEDS